MRRMSKMVVVATVGGTLALGGIAVAVPVLAGQGGPGGVGRPGGAPAGQSQVVAGYGPGDGTCLNLPASSGSLTESQRVALAGMAEDEKLAHDLYAAFADRYDARIFDQIAAVETRHLDSVRTLLDRYGVADPTAGKGTGEFASADVKATYDKLLAQGAADEQAALQAGVTVEKVDLAALDKADDGLDAADVSQVYANLRAASEQHLSAFQSWLGE